jgi:hypothetical protein
MIQYGAMMEASSINVLNQMVFRPFDVENVGTEDSLDPDINFFQNMSNLNCEYYHEHQFCDVVNNNDYVSLIHLNVRSLPKNMDQLTVYLRSLGHSFTVIGLSETWLTDNNKDLYHMPGYNSLHECRQNKRGGGVSLFIHGSAEYTVRTDLR